MKPLSAYTHSKTKKKKVPCDRFMRVDEVLYLVGFSRSTLYRRMRDSELPFPKQIKISEAMAVWSEQEVAAWMKEQKAKGDWS
jgi:predicted DNA-binding transcriptional regulator AlpA